MKQKLLWEIGCYLMLLLSFAAKGQEMSMHEIRVQIRQEKRELNKMEVQHLRIENLLASTPRKRRIEAISTGAELSFFLLTIAAGHSETDHPRTNFARHWNQDFWNHQISSGKCETVYGYHFDAFHIGNSLGRIALEMVIAKYFDRLFPSKYNGKLKRWIECEVAENLCYNFCTRVLNR